MIKVIKFVTHCYYWIQVFAAAFLIFGIIALIIFSYFQTYEIVAYILLGAGAVAGIFFAEYVRRKHGYDVFLSKVFGSADIDGKIRLRT